MQFADFGAPEAFQITSLAGGEAPRKSLSINSPGGDGDHKPPHGYRHHPVDAPNFGNGPLPFEPALTLYPPPIADTGAARRASSFCAPAVGTLDGYTFSTNADGEVPLARFKSPVRVAPTVPLKNSRGAIHRPTRTLRRPGVWAEIVNSVARAWVISGFLAVIVAFIGGWSRGRIWRPRSWR